MALAILVSLEFRQAALAEMGNLDTPWQTANTQKMRVILFSSSPIVRIVIFIVLIGLMIVSGYLLVVFYLNSRIFAQVDFRFIEN